MATFRRRLSFAFFIVLALAAIVDAAVAGTYSTYRPPVSRPGAWKLAHATFYGDETASATAGV